MLRFHPFRGIGFPVFIPSPERALLFPLGGCIPRRVRSGDFGIHRGIFRFRSFPVARFTTFALIPRLRPAPLPAPPVSTIGSLSHRLDTLRQRRFLHLAFHELFDGRKTPAVAAVHKRDGRTRGFSTGGTSNSVDVIFWIVRDVIIDNHIDFHYDGAPRTHIGTDNDRQRRFLHLAFHVVFDGRKTPAVAAVHKRDGRTRGFSTGGTSNSVDVIFWIGRYVIIDNQIDSHYVDAPRKHIGTDKDGQLLVLETQQYLFPFFLRQVRMERLHRS